MSDRLVVALDAMGGDKAPKSVVKGAAIARERFPQIQFLLYGVQSRLAPLVERLPILTGCTTIRHTDDFVTGDAKPTTALRQGRQSSMRLALDAVAAGEAQCMVSAGNTGALMAMAKFALKTLPGIDRPAIATFFPTQRGESVMLDLGANVECDAENLVQFALMGEVFARTVLGLARPSVALLNIGSEELKGNDAVRGAALRLRAPGSPINFLGYIEGDDIGAGTADVIVTDGFTGNVALKTAEGTAKLFSGFVRAAFESSALGEDRLSLRQAGIAEAARAPRRAALQRRGLPGARRHRGEKPWQHRRTWLRQRDRRRRRHVYQRFPRQNSR